MGYLTVKQFSEIWGITERRIIKLCKENRIKGAIKNGMIWEIPEETLKPSDKRSNIYKYINVSKRIMIIDSEDELKKDLQELLTKKGYVVEFEKFSIIRDNLDNISQYYEGLIFFPTNNLKECEETFITNFSKKLNSESSIVIVDYKRNKIQEKLSNKLKSEIGLKINTLILDFQKNKDTIVNYNEIAEDIVELLTKLKNTTGITITTDGGKIEFDKNRRTKDLEIGIFYKAINNYFKKLNKESYLWCASTMLEDEWTESSQEMKFRLINLEVANRGVRFGKIPIRTKFFLWISSIILLY